MFVALLFVGTLMAQELAIDFGIKSNTDVVENSMEKVKVNYSFNGIRTFVVKTEKGNFNEIAIPGANSVGALGTPKLPAAKDLIEIPFGAEVSVKVTNYKVTKYNLKAYGIENPLMPMQPSLSKDQVVEEVPFEYNAEAYAAKSFEGSELATVEVLGTMRGIRIARLVVAPVKYNPVSGEIEVYNNVEVEVNFSNADKSQSDYIKSATWSPYFNTVYNVILNRSAVDDYPDHPDLMKYPTKMLVVADRMFEETLAPFIDWKTKTGFEMIVAYTDEIGSSYNQVQTWVHDQYNSGTPEDPAPTFLLLVGDREQVPMEMGSDSDEYTDLYYGSVDGDIFPEMYYGRMSAQNVSQLQAILNKTLYYEKYQFENPEYLDRVTLIAGADGNWNPKVGQPTVSYGVDNYFNAAHGYTTVNDYYTTYDGCYETVNEGVGYINYTAHCSDATWSDPALTMSDVNAFTNEHLYTIAVGNCCQSHKIGIPECIGETWMRKPDGGSVIYIGSAPSTYWFEDFYWAVGAFPVQGTNDGYVPTVEETTLGVFDAMHDLTAYNCADATIFVGNLAVTEVDVQGYPQHSSPIYYWQAYMLGGDPSLLPYHTQGTENTVSHMEIMPIGVSFYEVSADPGSYVGISKDGVLHGAAYVDESGTVEIPLEPVTSGGDVDIVVTAPQKIPYVVTVPAAALEGPYVVMDAYAVNDASSNNNGQVDFGETFTIDVTLKNVGADSGIGISATVTGSDEYFTCNTSGSVDFGNVANDASVTVNDAFEFTVAENVPNDYQAMFVLEITDGNETWTSNLRMKAYAPILECASAVTIDDASFGNGNGMIDAGEKIIVSIDALNNGGCAAEGTNATLTTTSEDVVITEGQDALGAVEAGSSQTAEFTIQVNNGVPLGTVVNLDFEAVSGSFTTSTTYSITVGLIIENFESGDLSAYDWETSGNAEWAVQSDVMYEGDYAVASGEIDDNQESVLEITADVLNDDVISFYCKVSSESSYDFLKFYIDGVEKGSWSGEVAWTMTEYDVEVGEHTFKWVYAKDGSQSDGADKAWLDNIIFPPMALPAQPLSASVSASASGICLGGETQLFAMAAGGSGNFSYSWTPANAVDDASISNPLITATAATEFTCTITDNETSESANASISLDVVEAPTVEVEIEEEVLVAYASEGVTYQWFDDNGEISGAVENTFTPEQNGNYYCVVANNAGCEQTSATILVDFIGITNNVVTTMNIFPNPAENMLSVEYYLVSNSKVSINIYNTVGELVKTVTGGDKVAGQHQQNISVEELTAGIYVIILQSDEFRLTEKLIIK